MRYKENIYKLTGIKIDEDVSFDEFIKNKEIYVKNEQELEKINALIYLLSYKEN